MSGMQLVLVIALMFLGLYVLLQVYGAIVWHLRGQGDGKIEAIDLGYAPPKEGQSEPQVPNLSDQVERATQKRKKRRFYPPPRRSLPGAQRPALHVPPCAHCGTRATPQTDGLCGNCGAPLE